MNAPLYLARSGRVDGDSIYLANSVGNYWSSTVQRAEVAYSLVFYFDNIIPGNYNYRHVGFNLRCVLREPWFILLHIHYLSEAPWYIMLNNHYFWRVAELGGPQTRAGDSRARWGKCEDRTRQI